MAGASRGLDCPFSSCCGGMNRAWLSDTHPRSSSVARTAPPTYHGRSSQKSARSAAPVKSASASRSASRTPGTHTMPAAPHACMTGAGTSAWVTTTPTRRSRSEATRAASSTSTSAAALRPPLIPGGAVDFVRIRRRARPRICDVSDGTAHEPVTRTTPPSSTPSSSESWSQALPAAPSAPAACAAPAALPSSPTISSRLP